MQKILIDTGEGFIISHDQQFVTKYEDGKKKLVPGIKNPKLFQTKGRVYEIATMVPHPKKNKFTKILLSVDTIKRLYAEIVAIENTESEEEPIDEW